MFAKYGWEIDLKIMCNFCHICVSFKQHTFQLNFQHNLYTASCFKGENVFFKNYHLLYLSVWWSLVKRC